MLDNDLLVGSTDIVERLGLKSRQNVHYYLSTVPSFPRPLGTLGGVMLWRWPDIEEWAATYKFRQRTPPVHAPRSVDFQAAMDRLAAELGIEPERAVDLVGCYEIGHRLRFDKTMDVYRLARDETSGFPAPVAEIDASRATLIWWWPDVAKWADEHEPERIRAWRVLVAEPPAGHEHGAAPPAAEKTAAEKAAMKKAAEKKAAKKSAGGTASPRKPTKKVGTR